MQPLTAKAKDISFFIKFNKSIIKKNYKTRIQNVRTTEKTKFRIPKLESSSTKPAQS